MNYTKDSVYIRKKKLSNETISLYLDIYSNGIRKYEFLKLYLIPESGRKSKLQNKETMYLAEQARIQKLAEISKHPFKSTKHDTRLCWFVKECISKKSEGTAIVYNSVLRLVELFFGNDYAIEDITEEKIREFYAFIGEIPNKTYQNKKLSKSTQHLYCTTFNTILRHAADEDLVPYDITKRIKIVKKEDNARQYLSIEEVQLLVKTRIIKTYRRAFLFSCLTGLRESDISKLLWGDVVEQDGFTRIIFKQKKTRSIEYLDISPQARQMMGTRGNDNDKVFNRFNCTRYTNKSIQKWIDSVGIHKKITFHCARHTFAVMMLTLDTDIYTTSKLLGHKKLETTQIYAKIVDKKKQEAVTKIPIII